MTATLPEAMKDLIGDFLELSVQDRLQLLLELSDELPDLPERYEGHLDQLERVDECQTPLFLVVELDPPGDPNGAVHLFFHAPPESPTTRGFAGILHTGLDGQSVDTVLSVPDDVPFEFGLAEAVSPLRMRGMVAMLGRIKRQVHEQAQV